MALTQCYTATSLDGFVAVVGGGAPLFPRRQELRLEEIHRNRDFAWGRYALVYETA